MRSSNCWEFMNCGREPGGTRADEQGVCPAAVETRADGIHNGSMGGRACWAIAGTLCKGGKSSGTFAKKHRDCLTCVFYNAVLEKEGTNLLGIDRIFDRVMTNCWEYQECGREPHGVNENRLGPCPAATETRADGIHGGKNGGRACWAIAGTLCNGRIQGSFVSKFNDCIRCPFLENVQAREGDHLLSPDDILIKISERSGHPESSGKHRKEMSLLSENHWDARAYRDVP